MCMILNYSNILYTHKTNGIGLNLLHPMDVIIRVAVMCFLDDFEKWVTKEREKLSKLFEEI